MAKRMPIVNDGYIAGSRQRPLVIPDTLSPHEKGEYRRSYWQGYCAERLIDIAGCVKYATADNRAWLAQRLDVLYRETLVQMYGEAEAKKFLDEAEDPIYGTSTSTL